MISLHSILAAGGLMESLPTIILAVIGVALAIAFVMGFVKGFRKVSWNGLAWLAAGVMFVAVGKLAPMKGSSEMGTAAITLGVALACSLVTFAVFGVLGYFLRPKMRWIKDDINGDTSLAEYGLEFEPEYLDYDGEHDYAPYGKRIYKTGYGTPCFFFRLLGGLTCAINIGMVLAALLGAFLMIVGATGLASMSIGSILNNENMKLILGFAQKYLFEFLSIGIILLMAKQGYNKGLISSLRAIVITIGGFAAVGLSFYLPFSAYAVEGFIGTLVTRCAGVFASLGSFSTILGKLLAGCCLLALFCIALVLLNVLLKNVCKLIESIGLTRGLDSCLAAVVYMLIGAALCVGVWFVLAGLDLLGIFYVSKMLDAGAYLSNGLYNFAVSILAPLLAA